MLVDVDRHTDTVTCRPLHARPPHEGARNPKPLLAEVAGVVMTPAPRRPAAAETTVVELLRWQPYGVRVDESAERLRCVCGHAWGMFATEVDVSCKMLFVSTALSMKHYLLSLLD